MSDVATSDFELRLIELAELDGRELSDIIAEIKTNLERSREADPFGMGDFTVPSRVLRRMIEEIEHERKLHEEP